MLTISHAQLSSIFRVFDRIEHSQRVIVELILSMEKQMSAELEKLRTEIAENKSVMDGAVVLITDMATKMRDAVASGDMAAVAALADELDANTAALSAAVAANTPAAVVDAPVETPVDPSVSQDPAPTE